MAHLCRLPPQKLLLALSHSSFPSPIYLPVFSTIHSPCTTALRYPTLPLVYIYPYTTYTPQCQIGPRNTHLQLENSMCQFRGRIPCWHSTDLDFSAAECLAIGKLLPVSPYRDTVCTCYSGGSFLASRIFHLKYTKMYAMTNAERTELCINPR